MIPLFRGLAWAIGLEAIVVAVLAGTAGRAQAAELTTADQVIDWISAYSWQDATAAYPYDALYRDSLRVARCESARFDVAVLNNARRGPRGEVGVYQFLPGPHSIFWATPSAAAGWDYWDPEANVAGAVWLISKGFGPTHWSCW